MAIEEQTEEENEDEKEEATGEDKCNGKIKDSLIFGFLFFCLLLLLLFLFCFVCCCCCCCPRHPLGKVTMRAILPW